MSIDRDFHTQQLFGFGGEQTVSRLGPFHIAHDTAGITGNGAVLAAIDADTVIIRAWAIVTEAFGGTGTALFVGLGDAVTGDWSPVVVYSGDAPAPIASPSPGGSGGSTRETGTPITANNICMAVTACSLLAATSGNPDAGEADIYALIAEAA